MIPIFFSLARFSSKIAYPGRLSSPLRTRIAPLFYLRLVYALGERGGRGGQRGLTPRVEGEAGHGIGREGAYVRTYITPRWVRTRAPERRRRRRGEKRFVECTVSAQNSLGREKPR